MQRYILLFYCCAIHETNMLAAPHGPQNDEGEVPPASPCAVSQWPPGPFAIHISSEEVVSKASVAIVLSNCFINNDVKS